MLMWTFSGVYEYLKFTGNCHVIYYTMLFHSKSTLPKAAIRHFPDILQTFEISQDTEFFSV